MPRPRLDENQPPASNRLQTAFWEALEEHPFKDITVTEIARRAGVNKNTFYYHYANMDELAQSSIQDSLLYDISVIFFGSTEKPQPPISDMAKRIEELPSIALKEDNQERWKRLSLIAGPHGSNQLISYVKEFILHEWLTRMNVDYDRLNLNARITISFTLSGIIGLLSSDFIEEDEKSHVMQTFFESDLFRNTFKSVYPVMLRARTARSYVNHPDLGAINQSHEMN